MIDFKEVITYNDQPVTCPDCGNRTEITLDLSHTIKQNQIHKCLSENCRNEFVTQNDNE